MSKSNTTENDIIQKIFHAVELSWDAAVSLDIHLHTADPGEAGVSTTNEATYTNYAVVTVSRSASGWDVAGNQASNDDLLQFPQCGASGNTITHVSITPAGSTQIIYSGALNASLAVANLIQPQFAIGALTITED